jgi:hypothetical protein
MGSMAPDFRTGPCSLGKLTPLLRNPPMALASRMV